MEEDSGTSRRRRRWARRLLLLAVVAGFFGITTPLERKRLAVVLPGASTEPPASLDGGAILSDLRQLASPAFEGRATGTPGGLAARAFVAQRFREAGVEPFGGTFEQPFSFTHRSIRALVRRDRPFAKRFEDAANVVGRIPGTACPDRWIVVSAHYDHLGVRKGKIYPGADDNASGTAALLGLARFLKQHPLRHSVLLASFDAEELGKRGSVAFVAKPAVPLDRMALEVNLDMLSRSKDGSIVVSGISPQPGLRPVVEAAAAQSTVKVHLGHDRPFSRAGLVENWTGSSDHGPFADAGIAWLYFGVEDHEDYHRPGDTAERIDQAFYLRVCELVRKTIAEADDRLDPR